MPKVGNKHYPYTKEGMAAANRDRMGRGLTATEGFDRPGQLADASGRAMMKKGGKVKGYREGKEVKSHFLKLISRLPKEKEVTKKTKKKAYKDMTTMERAALGRSHSRKVAGMKKGGKVQGYDSRLDESLGVRHGKKKEQKYKDRRDESKAMSKKGGGRAYAGNKSSGRSKASKRADGIARQGHTKGRLV